MSVQPFVRAIDDDVNAAFSLGRSDSTFDKVYNSLIEPTQTLPSRQLTFKVPSSTAPLISLIRDCFFTFDVKLTKPNKVKLEALPDLTIVNNFMHSLFSSVELEINNTQIGKEYNYAYKAYLINLLSYDNTAKYSHMRMEGYMPDTTKLFQEEWNEGYIFI